MNRINTNKLSIYNGSTDISNVLSVFKNDQSVTITSSQYLYIGFSKPINTFYIDISVANTGNKVLKLEKYNGSWSEIDKQDNTFGLTKSGHIYTNDFANEEQVAINGITKYWIRLSLGATSTSLKIRFIGQVFSDLESLIAEEMDIELYYPVDNETNTIIPTFLNEQISATKWLLNKLASEGKYKYNAIPISNLTEWDFLDIREVAYMCIAYTLHKIYLNRFDNKEDAIKAKADYYLQVANNGYDKFLGLLTIDTDNSGTVGEDEVEQVKPVYTRLNF